VLGGKECGREVLRHGRRSTVDEAAAEAAVTAHAWGGSGGGAAGRTTTPTRPRVEALVFAAPWPTSRAARPAWWPNRRGAATAGLRRESSPRPFGSGPGKRSDVMFGQRLAEQSRRAAVAGRAADGVTGRRLLLVCTRLHVGKHALPRRAGPHRSRPRAGSRAPSFAGRPRRVPPQQPLRRGSGVWGGLHGHEPRRGGRSPRAAGGRPGPPEDALREAARARALAGLLSDPGVICRFSGPRAYPRAAEIRRLAYGYETPTGG